MFNMTKGERRFNIFNIIFLSVLTVITLYPVYYVVVASLSDPTQVYSSNGILLYPKGFGLYSYQAVINNAKIWRGFGNTVFNVVFGGTLSVMMTILAAFGLSRKGLPGKNFMLFYVMFTMYFSGGLIPTYLLVKSLHITDTRLAMILPGAVSTYNLLVTLTYFRGLPIELEEAAKIDGASDYTVLFRIMLPLAKPIIAVIGLYYTVSIWNNYFNGLIYLTDDKLMPLQMVLREILIQNDTNSMSSMAQTGDAQAYSENIKYATIVVSTIPVMCVYPFLQKYFTQGVMIGAVKG